MNNMLFLDKLIYKNTKETKMISCAYIGNKKLSALLLYSK